jgi:hypothetical protein
VRIDTEVGRDHYSKHPDRASVIHLHVCEVGHKVDILIYTDCYTGDMNKEDSRRQFEAIMSEYRDLQARLTEGRARQTALYALLNGYMDIYPEFRDVMVVSNSQSSVDKNSTFEGLQAEKPRGQEAVRRVLQENPGRWFTVTGMVDELTSRGWAPDSDVPASAVRTALERLANQPESVIRKGRGEKTGAVTYSVPHGSKSNSR